MQRNLATNIFVGCLLFSVISTTVSAANCTPGRKYTSGLKNVANLTGAESKIKTIYGKLCTDDTGKNTAFQVAYVNVSKTGGTFIWAQSGWDKSRKTGSEAVSYHRYAEMQGNEYKVNFDTGNAPVDGTSHTYQVQLNTATGQWQYSYDGSQWESFTDDAWKDAKGTNVQYTGEIYNKEDDMPGTAENKVRFSDCKYRVDNGLYQDAGFIVSDLFTSDAAEWGVERVSGTAIDIWDKNPLP